MRQLRDAGVLLEKLIADAPYYLILLVVVCRASEAKSARMFVCLYNQKVFSVMAVPKFVYPGNEEEEED
ncbi:MAG: hypothetical protein EAZ79_23045 [Oscillatoriales cyanobacterium]|nr:MAG: hypothetical protein EAZ79_23045 [Oscillatoriales cyanobacterium]